MKDWPNGCKKYALRIESLYVNRILHDEQQADQSVVEVVAIAKTARNLGTRIVVANPTPIRWDRTEDKNDRQLRIQAKTLDRLGAELRQLGMTLAYHNHDAELRQGGREFHHTLTATDSKKVKLCLDAHWIFRMKGDIDYQRLFEFLQGKQIDPHLVLEQAVEEKSPNRLTVVEAHRLGRTNLQRSS